MDIQPNESFGYLAFTSSELAAQIMIKYNGFRMDGRPIQIEWGSFLFMRLHLEYPHVLT